MGASREMRPVGSPNQYSSATMSPRTSSFVPLNPSSRPSRRCLLTGITLGWVLPAGQEDHLGNQQDEQQEGDVGRGEGAVQLQHHEPGAAQSTEEAPPQGAQGARQV